MPKAGVDEDMSDNEASRKSLAAKLKLSLHRRLKRKTVSKIEDCVADLNDKTDALVEQIA